MSKVRAAGVFASLTLMVLGACAGGDELLGTIQPGSPDAGPSFEPPFCPTTCSEDKRSLVNACNDGAFTPCGPTEECREGRCIDACKEAEDQKSSVGCDYYAVMMDIVAPYGLGACFVAFVTNTFSTNAHITATLKERPIDLARYAKLPVGQGRSLGYADYDPARGLAPGEVAILFLSNWGGVECPVPAPRSTGAFVRGSGIGQAFHIQSDVPVVAFQMLPYGGGNAALTGASLLLPTSAWGTNYVAVNAYRALGPETGPSLDVVAYEDQTTVQITPTVAIKGTQGLLPGGPAGVPISYTLNRGEVLQLTQQEELTGSPIISDKKIGLFGGHQCMNVPADVGYCDHAEQQIAPVQALGNEYVALPHRARQTKKAEKYLWRLVGVVDGTVLTYDPPIVTGPAQTKAAEYVEFETDGPFVVKSQDPAHPFMLFGYMSGGDAFEQYGDPDFVRVVPPPQWLDKYLFFTDPTYPETNLVVVRKRTPGGTFEDVNLDCYGRLEGWTALGPDYEMTRTDLVRHDFEPQGKCDNGVHEMTSKAPFGVTVWAWGTPETSKGVCDETTDPLSFTCNVSYAYPAGERVLDVNDIIAGPPIVK
jgi:IgGFc binding protein